MWITRAKRQLTIKELQHALAVRPGLDELDEENISHITDILSACAGLVIVDDESNIVRLVHYTTKEYFERTWKHWFKNAETEITKTCLSYLKFCSFENGPCQELPQLKNTLEAYRLYDYCARNWAHHAREASAVIPEVLDFLACGMKLDASYEVLLRDMTEPIGHSSLLVAPKINKIATGLHIGSYFGAVELVKILLGKSLAINFQDRCGHEPMTELQIENRTNTEAKEYQGRTAFSMTAGVGHEAEVKLLIDHGANIEAEGHDGRTPIFQAVRNGRREFVRLLVQNGADVTIAGDYGMTPLENASTARNPQTVKALLDYGAESILADEQGFTPLYIAFLYGHLEVVQLLLES
ncbi:hypothetical protein PITC_081010 [Penicillium italicum]|uniref:GPI inositol-deacylase winged helix domain-containing protein n=1 Tax=Penicillium italicum TaxID=40296 RepID=A0A0A2LFK7_PENIT|nr:hypothetical protein PITC_081010 [Penicillium italicum]